MRVAIVMPERAQLPVDKDVKAFKKYMDNLRRKWVTFSARPVYTLFDYILPRNREIESANLYRSDKTWSPIASNIKGIVLIRRSTGVRVNGKSICSWLFERIFFLAKNFFNCQRRRGIVDFFFLFFYGSKPSREGWNWVISCLLIGKIYFGLLKDRGSIYFRKCRNEVQIRICNWKIIYSKKRLSLI